MRRRHCGKDRFFLRARCELFVFRRRAVFCAQRALAGAAGGLSVRTGTGTAMHPVNFAGDAPPMALTLRGSCIRAFAYGKVMGVSPVL